MVRPVQLEDAHAISKIYNYYILNSVVTFETTPVTIEEMRARIQTKQFDRAL
ncbi:hypothetical protein JYT59_00145 [Sphingobacteriaceae bacterium AH-315-L07]|nr:hypothetical protein [Sphingobacteriaceae bacterium AH-315-L07]